MHSRWRLCVVAVSLLVMSACTNSSDRHSDDATTTGVPEKKSPLRDRPLPPRVAVGQKPEGATLGDPAFTPLPGARAESGTLGGAVYQIEIPENWNGRLVMWMHGFEEFAPEAKATPPDFRRYLIANGIAWAASSFSTTSFIPGRAADETAALWDRFVRKHGRPSWTYIAGQSMGGWAAHIAAERYADRFDGALGLCGSAGTTPGLRISVEALVAGAYVAGITQTDIDEAPNIDDVIAQQVRPALRDPQKHTQFENILIDLTGGPRAFAREGIHLEEDTNWTRVSLLVAAGLVPPRDTPYRLGPGSDVTSADFNENAIRLPANEAALSTFTEGMEVTGNLQMPLVTLHTTGDGQTPIDQAKILRQRADAAGRGDLLVTRVIKDAGHCGFSTGEQEAAFSALAGWVERGEKPEGTKVNVDDLGSLDRTFELQPRPATPEADDVSAAAQRAVVSGRARLDGAAFDARWLGAVVRDGRLVTPCQYTLPPVEAGQFEITLYGANESAGCGRSGAEMLFWTFVGDQMLYANAAIPWPAAGTVEVGLEFSTAAPSGAAPATTGVFGEVYQADGQRVATGARVEAYIGDTVCAVASIRSSGDFVGYTMDIVGPDSIPECVPGATVTFRVDGVVANETFVNSPDQDDQLDLTLQ